MSGKAQQAYYASLAKRVPIPAGISSAVTKKQASNLESIVAILAYLMLLGELSPASIELHKSLAKQCYQEVRWLQEGLQVPDEPHTSRTALRPTPDTS